MPNPDAAPQRPGKLVLNLEPGNAKVSIDGYRLEQFITELRLRFGVTTQRPILEMDLDLSAVDVTASTVELNGEFRDFLIAHGWRPPT